MLKMLFVSLPLWLLIIYYISQDPFKVTFSYERYYQNDSHDIMLNRDFVSTELFLKHYPERRYNSFVFGSSKSVTFSAKKLQEKLGDEWFHFDSFNETLFGIYTKLKFLDEHEVKIKRVFICIDTLLLSGVENSKGHLYIKHPEISKESNLTFQWEFLSVFLNNQFFIPYVCRSIDVTTPGYLEYPPITHAWKYRYDEINNDKYYYEQEGMIQKDSIKYFKENDSFNGMDPLAGKMLSPLIADNQLQMLNEIKAVLDKNQTKYIIILYPNYDKRKFNSNDLYILQRIFEKDNVFNWSGINDITKDKGNYINNVHLRQSVGDEIINNIIYSMIY